MEILWSEHRKLKHALAIGYHRTSLSQTTSFALQETPFPFIIDIKRMATFLGH